METEYTTDNDVPHELEYDFTSIEYHTNPYPSVPNTMKSVLHFIEPSELVELTVEVEV